MIRQLIRSGPTRIYFWPADYEGYAPAADSVHTPTPSVYAHFPTLKQATEWADRDKGPLMQAIPFQEER